MNTNPRLLAALVLTGLSACQIAHDPGDGRVGSASQAISTTCGARRWIGSVAPCASVGNWNASSLFPGAAPPLDQFCVYDWTAMLPPTPIEIAALPVLTGAGELAEDCPVVVPYSYDTLLGEELRAGLKAHVGTVETLGVYAKTKQPVRVVVVDTAPDSGDSTEIRIGNDRHGDTLASVIRDIGCGPLGCGVEVVSALGLPWLDETTRSEEGGHVGRLSDIAVAVHGAIEAAQTQGRDRVIINLSVGWEHLPGLAECDDLGGMTAPTHAVFEVLQRATCAGALVIAAAGNDAGGPQAPSGMACPARWEARSVTCDNDLDGDPMVHAVGGVDYADQPIAITRPQGRPRLAAPSFGGIGWTDDDLIPSPLTGTSVAAAVASGVAAVVWSQRPNLQPTAVIDALHASGVVVGVADVCPAGGSVPCDVRRISLCTALGSAGVLGLNCAASPARPVSTPLLSSQLLALAAIELSGPGGGAVAEVADLTLLPRYLADSPALSGGVFPQPVVPVCPSCIFSYGPWDAVFHARLTEPLNEARLVLETPSATMVAPLTTTTGSSNLPAGPYTFEVTSAPPGATRAWLTGYADANNTVSTTYEVLVAQ